MPTHAVQRATREEMKELVAAEARYRSPYERERKIWTGRASNYRLFEVSDNVSCLIANADGIIGNTQPLEILCAARGFTSSAHIDRYLDKLRGVIKLSVAKEKFMRHVHNMNHAEALRYHTRLVRYASLHMEQFQENPHLACAGIDNTVNGGTLEHLPPNDQGYIEFCAEMQRAHDWRTKLLADIKE